MRGISDRIEAFITELLKNEDSGWLELRRNELASVFNCVPSQINYVIATRFGPDNGYIVESRRGGGGYMRIKKISRGGESPVEAAIHSCASPTDAADAQALISRLEGLGAIDSRSARLMHSAVSDKSIPAAVPDRDIVRSGILKAMLCAYVSGDDM